MYQSAVSWKNRFYVRINLQLHAITCPGVWLCTHGYLEATLKTLGYYFRTGAMEPRFPLFCHDEFRLEGYFKSVSSMADLQRVLGAEYVELTLWQHGRRLAYFTGQLADIMHTSVGMPKLSCTHNINVQLLLKPTKAFPGIIAPKVELSATMDLQDRLSGGHKSGSANSNGSQCTKHRYSATQLVTPNFASLGIRNGSHNRHCQMTQGGSCLHYFEDKRRQRPVCHAKERAACDIMNDHCPPRNNSRSSSISFSTDVLMDKSGLRRLSTSSNSLSQTTCCSSFCSHSSDTSVDDAHQRVCITCQTYRKTFM